MSLEHSAITTDIKIGIANPLEDHLTVVSFNKSVETMPVVKLEVV